MNDDTLKETLNSLQIAIKEMGIEIMNINDRIKRNDKAIWEYIVEMRKEIKK